MSRKKERTLGDAVNEIIQLQTWTLVKGYRVASMMLDLARKAMLDESLGVDPVKASKRRL